jgi:Protein of unknown function (DUF4087)
MLRKIGRKPAGLLTALIKQKVYRRMQENFMPALAIQQAKYCLLTLALLFAQGTVFGQESQVKSDAVINSLPSIAAKKVSTRCGWYDNLTPGNSGLADRQGYWLIGVQGGHQAIGDLPKFSKARWISKNRSYGYGCACLKVETDEDNQTITQIISSRSVSLKQCTKDSALKNKRPD